jgi:uncharacterized membrane protein
MHSDTWSSELGILSKTNPVLITTGRAVPRGTNGGVSMMGLIAAALGGAFMGCTFYLVASTPESENTDEKSENIVKLAAQWPVIILGLMSGLGGSLVDSLLGATVQYSGLDRKTNKVVNHPTKDAIRISGANMMSNDMVCCIG